MTNLLTMDAEARRALGRLPKQRAQALQTSLVKLCETHWPEMRGPEPAGKLAKALWEIRPYLADLFVHLYDSAGPRLDEILNRLMPPQALALLVLAEIERGYAEGARRAYAAMRAFELPESRESYVRARFSAFSGHPPDASLMKAHRPALWRALIGLAVQTGRWETKAIVEAIRQVVHADAGGANESDMRRILDMLAELGVAFLAVDDDHVVYALRGEKREPVSFKQIAEMLAEAEQA